MMRNFPAGKITYRTRATINRGYYYFFLKSYVGFSLMIGGIPLKMCGYKTRAVINRTQLITARIRYILSLYKSSTVLCRPVSRLISFCLRLRKDCLLLYNTSDDFFPGFSFFVRTSVPLPLSILLARG